MTGPVLETERLILRPPTIGDFPRWAEMMGDAEAAKFLGGAQPAATAWRGFMSMAGAWSLTGVSMFSLVERGTGLWLGRIGPWTPLGWPGTEVGWGLHPDAQGRGYGVEAATATLDYAFDGRRDGRLHLHRFDNDGFVICLHRFANRHEYLEHLTGHGGQYFLCHVNSLR